MTLEFFFGFKTNRTAWRVTGNYLSGFSFFFSNFLSFSFQNILSNWFQINQLISNTRFQTNFTFHKIAKQKSRIVCDRSRSKDIRALLPFPLVFEITWQKISAVFAPRGESVNTKTAIAGEIRHPFCKILDLKKLLVNLFSYLYRPDYPGNHSRSSHWKKTKNYKYAARKISLC